MSTSSIPLHRKMFNMARGLQKGFLLLGENIFEGKKDGDYIPPAVLCTTFSLELLLKSLILVMHDDIYTEQDLAARNIDIKDHRYSRLFNMIEPDVRREVLISYGIETNENITVPDFIDKLKTLGDNNFAEWRYVFESGKDKHLDMQLQIKVIDSLGKTFERINREKKNITIRS